MSLFEIDHYADRDEEARRDAIDERRRAARLNHFCMDCLGHVGPGSPCAIEPDPEDETDD